MSKIRNRDYRDSVAAYIDAYTDIIDHRLTVPAVTDRSEIWTTDYSSIEERILAHCSDDRIRVGDPVTVSPTGRIRKAPMGSFPEIPVVRAANDFYYDSPLWTGRTGSWLRVGFLFVWKERHHTLGEERPSYGFFKDLAQDSEKWTFSWGYRTWQLWPFSAL